MAEIEQVTMEEDSNESFDEPMSDDGLDNLIVLDSSSMEDEEEEKVEAAPPTKKQKKDSPVAKKEVAKPKTGNDKSRHQHRSTIKSVVSSKKSSSKTSGSRKSEHEDRRRKSESEHKDKSKKSGSELDRSKKPGSESNRSKKPRSESKDRQRRSEKKPEFKDRKRNNIQETAKERKRALKVECAREIRQYGRHARNESSSNQPFDRKAQENGIRFFKKSKPALNQSLSVRSIAIQCNMPSKPATATEILDYCLFASRNRWSRQMQVKTTDPEHFIHTVLAAHPIRDVSTPLETYLEEWCQFGPSQEAADFFKSQGTADYPFFPTQQLGSYSNDNSISFEFTCETPYDNSAISSENIYETPDDSINPSETTYETLNDSSIISSETVCEIPNENSIIASETSETPNENSIIASETSETPNDDSMIS